MTKKTLSSEPVQVEVLFTAGCASTPPAVALMESTAQEMGIPIRLSRIEIATIEEAQAHRFQGSPTVLVNGLDIDPAVRHRASYGFT